jgi:hypothetical protein
MTESSMKPARKPARWSTLVAGLTMALVLEGCAEIRYTAPEPIPVELLPSYKQDNAEIRARIQVADFVVTSVDARFSDSGKERFRRYQGLTIPKRLYDILGQWRAFREVKRVSSPTADGADYTVSGTYEYREKRVYAPYYHEINVKGVLHISVTRARDGTIVLDKDYVEDKTDSASSFQAIRVQYLQDVFLQSIAVEIRRIVEEDVVQG